MIDFYMWWIHLMTDNYQNDPTDAIFGLIGFYFLWGAVIFLFFKEPIEEKFFKGKPATCNLVMSIIVLLGVFWHLFTLTVLGYFAVEYLNKVRQEWKTE